MLRNIPQEKWDVGTGRQVILKNDFAYIEQAVLEAMELQWLPELTWVDNTAVKVAATADCRARVVLAGLPSPVHRGLLVHGGMTDGRYRENAAEVFMDFDNPAHFWGTEKSSQWYVIYATAAEVETTFVLKAMPVMRLAAQAAQVITLRNNANSAGIGYGFTTDELKDGKILVLTGAAKGLLRTITANNNNNDTAGTVTYSGTALAMTPGDWFVVLPPGTNFRYLGMILNNSSGNIEPFYQRGTTFCWYQPRPWVSGAINGWTAKPLDLQAPVTARLVHGVIHADYGYSLKVGFSLDGTHWSRLVHVGYPGSGFKSTGAAVPFSFMPLADHSIYLDNENTAGQNYVITGWEE